MIVHRLTLGQDVQLLPLASPLLDPLSYKLRVLVLLRAVQGPVASFESPNDSVRASLLVECGS